MYGNSRLRPNTLPSECQRNGMPQSILEDGVEGVNVFWAGDANGMKEGGMVEHSYF